MSLRLGEGESAGGGRKRAGRRSRSRVEGTEQWTAPVAGNPEGGEVCLRHSLPVLMTTADRRRGGRRSWQHESI